MEPTWALEHRSDEGGLLYSNYYHLTPFMDDFSSEPHKTSTVYTFHLQQVLMEHVETTYNVNIKILTVRKGRGDKEI